MYRLLNKDEIIKFAKKYLPMWTKDINKVSLISYHGVKEYLVNDHYLITVKGFKIFYKDLQFI